MSSWALFLYAKNEYIVSMRIGIVGGGASGGYLAIRLKELNKDFDVSIIERNDRLFKKITVTGNGRCNYANLGSTVGKYNNDEFANKILNNLPAKNLLDIFDKYGIHPTQIGDLVYPVTYSAQTVVLMLEKRIKELGVDVYLNENVVDYIYKDNKYEVITNISSHYFDALVFTSGGKAYPQLGTNGDIINLLKRHDYKVVEPSASLCPIKVRENTKKISGQRVKCRVYLYNKDLYYEEDGEVLFKDDGLSGIVILNMTNKINSIPNKNNIKIVLDLAYSYKDINEAQYEEYVPYKVASYLKENKLDIHHLSFTFKDFYDFKVAEVTHGGISLSNINHESLESLKEKNLYFGGEILDVDGMCGGYNLMFAFASAETVATSITKKDK